MPPAVAAYQAEQARRHRESADDPSSELAGVHSLEQLRSLSPAEILARHFQAHDPEQRLQTLLAAGVGPLPPDLPPAILRPSNRVIGSVPEGDSLTHVVYRTHFGADIDPPAPP